MESAAGEEDTGEQGAIEGAAVGWIGYTGMWIKIDEPPSPTVTAKDGRKLTTLITTVGQDLHIPHHEPQFNHHSLLHR